MQKHWTPAALNRLALWHWPGNVRELRTVVERLVVTEAGAHVSAQAVGKALDPATDTVEGPPRPARDLAGDEIQALVRDYEAVLLKSQVARSGSIRKASVATGISVSTIKRKLAWARDQNARSGADAGDS